ncbi:hypothetical protein NQ314_015487, partial [Rhamnusium bicolor]
YNTEQRLYGGQLIVRRRHLQKEHRTEEHYVPCAKCKGFFSKLNLRNHFRKCTERKLQGCRRSLALGRRLRSSLHENACDLLRDKVFPILREDDTIRDIRYDELLIRYANDLCTKFASRRHCYSLIRNEQKLKEVDNTALLMKQGLSTSVNVYVKEAQINKRRKKQIVLPSRQDISKLMVYLYSNQEKYYNLVKNKSFEKRKWVQLVEFTMLCIQAFNRRRPGETERILIEDFERRETISENTNPEMYNALSEEEKKMTQRYCRFQLRGKLVKNVAVLLNNEIEQSIELILHYRDKAGVPKNNQYVRICSCHFFGEKDNYRELFKHNDGKMFEKHHLTPEKAKKRRRLSFSETECRPSTSTEEHISDQPMPTDFHYNENLHQNKSYW